MFRTSHARTAWKFGPAAPDGSERAGLNSLNEGQKVSFDVQEERGKLAAVNLKA